LRSRESLSRLRREDGGEFMLIAERACPASGGEPACRGDLWWRG